MHDCRHPEPNAALVIPRGVPELQASQVDPLIDPCEPYLNFIHTFSFLKRLSGRELARVASVNTPSDRVELKVVGAKLPIEDVWHVHVVDALDGVFAGAEAVHLPAPGDVVAVVEDGERGHGWEGWGAGGALDEGCSACECGTANLWVFG